MRAARDHTQERAREVGERQYEQVRETVARATRRQPTSGAERPH